MGEVEVQLNCSFSKTFEGDAVSSICYSTGWKCDLLKS